MSDDPVAAKAISDLATAREKIAALREALEEIRDADQTEMALDPAWPSRIARAALETSGGVK